MAIESVFNLKNLSSEIGISEIKLSQIIICSQSYTNFVNYLAEVSESSPQNVKEAIIFSKFGEITIEESIKKIAEKLPKASQLEIANTFKNTIVPELLINMLIQSSGKSAEDIENALLKSDFKKSLLSYRIARSKGKGYETFKNGCAIRFVKSEKSLAFAANKIQMIGFGAPARKSSYERIKAVEDWISFVDNELKNNPPSGFQEGIYEYYEKFMNGPMPENEAKLLSDNIKKKYGKFSAEIIDNFILERFGSVEDKKCSSDKKKAAVKNAKSRIKYVITFGIGGNEMRWHVLSHFNNTNVKSSAKWIPVNFYHEFEQIPDDANSDNTIQIAYSRSGDTEETKAAVEVLGKRFPNAIIYANKGELKSSAEAMGALVLPFPPKIAGRYCGLKTPVNLVPMYILDMDIKKYWAISDKAANALKPKSKLNPAWEIAKFIFREKMLSGVKMIYLGHNNMLLKKSLDEASQFIMEGLAKEGNELFSMVGMQYPRNSHYEIEGPLGNPNFWLYLNLIYTGVKTGNNFDRFKYSCSPNSKKQNLYADEILMTLIAGNLNTFTDKAPAIAILIDNLDIETFALLSKIYEDTIYYLCRLCMVDPFGNPAVKNVRMDSAKNVEKLYVLKQKKCKSEEILQNLINEKYR